MINPEVFKNVSTQYEQKVLDSNALNDDLPNVLFQNGIEKLFAKFIVVELSDLAKFPTGKLLLETITHLQNIFSIINDNIQILSQCDFDFDYVDPGLYITFCDSESSGSCFQHTKTNNSIIKKQMNIAINLNKNKLQYDKKIGFYCNVQALQCIELVTNKQNLQELIGITGRHKDPVKMLLAHELIHATHYMKEQIRNFIIFICKDKQLPLPIKQSILKQIRQYLIENNILSVSKTLMALKTQVDLDKEIVKENIELDEKSIHVLKLQSCIDTLLQTVEQNIGLDENYSNMLQANSTASLPECVTKQTELNGWVALPSSPSDEFGDILTNIEELITVTGPDISENLIRQEQKLAPRCLYQNSMKCLICSKEQIKPLLPSCFKVEQDEQSDSAVFTKINQHITQCEKLFYNATAITFDAIKQNSEGFIIQNQLAIKFDIKKQQVMKQFGSEQFDKQVERTKEQKIQMLNRAKENNNVVIARNFVQAATGQNCSNMQKEDLLLIIKKALEDLQK